MTQHLQINSADLKVIDEFVTRNDIDIFRIGKHSETSTGYFVDIHWKKNGELHFTRIISPPEEL